MKYITKQSLRDYKDNLIREEKSAATVKKYLRDIRMLETFLGTTGISKENILEYRTSLMKRFRPKTVNAKLSAVNSYLKFRGLDDCTVKFLKIQRQAFADDARELSRKEYQRLLSAAKKCANSRLYYIILTICGTGIRVSELQFVTVEAVQRGQIWIHLKGKDRTILLPKQLKKKLKKYVDSRAIKTGPVFCTRNGNPLDRSNICHEMKRICEDAGVDRKKVFPHNLRHLFARCFYEAEKNLVLLADILGHSSIETTRIYVAEGSRAQERILRKMQLIL